MERFKYYQPNDKDLKDRTGDCVIRALTKVMNKTWVEIYDELVPIGRRVQAFGNDQITYTTYLKENGFEYQGISNKKGSKRPTIKEFANKNREGTYFCKAANHVVAVVDGIYYDTWDSGRKPMYGYWKKMQK